MKKYIYVLVLILSFACDSEQANDCFQTTGSIIEQEETVDEFDKILVNRDISLVLKEGASHKVVVETGENLLNDVSISVVDKQLVLIDNNTCNYVRDYGITKVYVTAPNITEIRCSTQYDISSDGVLTYPSLSLVSENFYASESFAIGDFRLQINSITLNVVFNNLSTGFISGSVNNLNVTFASGDGRFEGENLIAQNVIVSHRGSNDIIVNPQQTLKGTIRSTGHVISKNTPPVIDVEQLYKGRLIFE